MYCSSSSSSSPEGDSKLCFPLPKDFEFVKILGRGGYGTVVGCVKDEGEEVMAVKVFPEKYSRNAQWEARVMGQLMKYNLDTSNIIKYLGTYSENESVCLMYEMLDISMEDYLNHLRGPMRLEHVRIVIQEMAVAFKALKSAGAIHADLKIDNIMMVDRMRQPFSVKLIDFGLAIFRWHARPGKTVQTTDNRAPEILLGLPFSEAIDIWALGCVMAAMVFFVQLVPASTEYNALRFITDLLGPPPQHLLNIGKKTHLYYKKIDDQWQLKTPEEYIQEQGEKKCPIDESRHNISSLDEMKTVRLERDNPREADERRECIELLKAMLQWDERDRITPSQILNHPFITQSYLNSSSNISGPSSSEPEATTSQKQMDVGTQTEDRISEALPPSVILVRPADPENRIHLTSHEDTGQSSHPTPYPASADDTPSSLVDTGSPTLVDSKVPKKKKRNCFRRFFFWVKRTFSCTVDTIE